MMKSSVPAFWKTVNAVLLLTLAALPGFAREEPGAGTGEDPALWKQSGSYRISVFRDLEDDGAYENTSAFFSRLRLENKLAFPESGLTFCGSFDFDYLRNGPAVKGDDGDASLKECYLDLEKENLALRAGRQYLTWGKLDNTTLLDAVNPQDYKLFILLDKQERKIPVFMLKLDWFSGDYRLEGVYLPVFEPSRLSYFGSDWSVFGRFRESVAGGGYPDAVKTMVGRIRIEDDDRLTENTGKNGQLGIRFLGRTGDVDYSLYYLCLFNRIPCLQEKTPGGNVLKRLLYLPSADTLDAWVNSNPGDDDYLLVREHERTNAVGADFETVLGACGVRGEIGLFTNLPYLREDFAYTTRDTLSGGLGVDHTTAGNLYFNFQFFQDLVLDYQELFAQERHTSVVTATARTDFRRGKLVAEFDSARNLSRGDWMLNPVVTYQFTGGINFSLGLFFFGGDPTTTLGRFSDKDLVYLETTGRF